jgi:hypothetical protein
VARNFECQALSNLALELFSCSMMDTVRDHQEAVRSAMVSLLDPTALAGAVSVPDGDCGS